MRQVEFWKSTSALVRRALGVVPFMACRRGAVEQLRRRLAQLISLRRLAGAKRSREGLCCERQQLGRLLTGGFLPLSHGVPRQHSIDRLAS